MCGNDSVVEKVNQLYEKASLLSVYVSKQWSFIRTPLTDKGDIILYINALLKKMPKLAQDGLLVFAGLSLVFPS